MGSHLRRTLGDSLATKLEGILLADATSDLTTLCQLPIDLVLTTSMGQGWERAFDARG